MENQLLYKCKSDFVSGHSTVYQLLEIYNDKICTALEERNQTCMVFFSIYRKHSIVYGTKDF